MSDFFGPDAGKFAREEATRYRFMLKDALAELTDDIPNTRDAIKAALEPTGKFSVPDIIEVIPGVIKIRGIK